MHEWTVITFVFGSWMECSCGFRANCHEDFDRHQEEINQEESN